MDMFEFSRKLLSSINLFLKHFVSFYNINSDSYYTFTCYLYITYLLSYNSIHTTILQVYNNVLAVITHHPSITFLTFE